MKILLTGGTGFVGSNIIQAFRKENCIIYNLDINESPLLQKEYQYNWNSLNKLVEKDFDVIIHLAGKAHDTRDTSEESMYFDVNYGLTKIIFDFFLESKATKFIYFSSVKAIADNPKEIITEGCVPNPQTPYGKSKLKAEKYIFEQQKSKDKQYYILRPSMIHGPGNKGNLNLLVKVVKSRIPWPLGAFNNQRSFTSISNLIYVLEQLVNENIISGIYNISDDETLSTNELISIIAKSENVRPLILNIPKSFILQMARLGDVLRLPLTSERLNKLTNSYIVSNDKIKKAINEKKLPVSTQDGMNKTLESFKNNQ